MNRCIEIILVCLLVGVKTAAAAMDDARLKEWLSGNFTAPESIPWEERTVFKDSRAITDEQLHRVLIEIYSEAAERGRSLTPKTREWSENRRTIEGILGWLPVCGDMPVKDFLLDYAAARENDYLNRSVAVLSYLRIADSEEAKNALLRFLVEGDRMDNMARLKLYGHARTAYDAAAPEKKAAILAALIAAANKEEGKIEFMKVDKILAERSAAYRCSRERLAMLERHSLEPPTTNLYTDRDLKAAIEESRKYKSHTSISTNLVALKSRDFNLPLPVSATNEVNETATESTEPKEGVEKNKAKTANPIGVLSLIGGAAALILGLGLWLLSRKR